MLRDHCFKLPIAQKIKDTYEERGLSQAAIAEFLKCDVEIIDSIEHSQEVYGKEQIDKLKTFLEIENIAMSENEREEFYEGLLIWRGHINARRLLRRNWPYVQKRLVRNLSAVCR